ncbi:MAG: CARDB domain-containing protein [bacterium]
MAPSKVRFLAKTWVILLYLWMPACPMALAETPNKLLFFNTLADLLRGDLWQWISQQELLHRLYIYPERFLVIGMGTTNWPERMGEVLVTGTVANTLFQWANPEYPYRVQSIKEGVFPWIQLAVVDPKSALEWSLERSQDLHGALIQRFRQEGIDRCALSIEAVTAHVEYSLTYRIPKSGFDLSVPAGRSEYMRSFQEEGRAKWILQGIYVDESLAPSCGIPPGQPLLLVGYNQETLNGGLVRLARVQNAKVRYFPIERHEVIKSDLSISDVRLHEGRVSIDIRNLGALTAEHLKVKLSLPDTERELEAVLPRVKPGEEVRVRFNVNINRSDRSLLIQLDPEEQILESDRSNNRVEKKQGLLGW